MLKEKKLQPKRVKLLTKKIDSLRENKFVRYTVYCVCVWRGELPLLKLKNVEEAGQSINLQGKVLDDEQYLPACAFDMKNGLTDT